MLLLGASIGLGAQDAPRPSRVDWSAMDAFWPIVDTLAADREPSAAAWARLYASEGLAALLRRERRRETFTQAFRMAFKPSLGDSLPLVTARSAWHQYHVPLIASLPQRRAAAERLRRDERDLDALVDSALALAAEWLPAGTIARYPLARIAWAPIAGNRGYPGHLVLDPTLFVQDPRRVHMLGHELHHHYRALIARPLRPLGDDLAAWALVNVESEGSAGQVDKRPLTQMTPAEVAAVFAGSDPVSVYYREYPAVFAASPRWLRLADSLLAGFTVLRDPTSRAALARQLHGALPDQGRAMGSWMFDRIVEAEGATSAVAVVGDPFEFWRAYQRVAAASRGRWPMLGAPAMRVLDSIAAQYELPPRSAGSPACAAAMYRAFDFWLGTWDVFGPAGAAAGRNVITRAHGGCAILESYVGGGGYTGQSINAYDVSRERWQQTWTDNSGLLLLLEGGSPRPGVMALEGTRRDAQGRAVRDRITWTANADGSVRQHWESSTDGGDAWTTTFDGRYVRVDDSARRLTPGASLLPHDCAVRADSFALSIAAPEGTRRPVGAVHVERRRVGEGASAVCQVVQRHHGAGSGGSDTSSFALATLAPRAYAARVGNERQHYRFTDRRAQGEHTVDGRSTRATDDSSEVPFFLAVHDHELLQSLPLHLGYRAAYRAYNPGRGFLDVVVAVTGVDTLRTGTRDVAAWRLRYDAGRAPTELWLAMDDLRLLQSRSRLPNGSEFWRQRVDVPPAPAIR